MKSFVLFSVFAVAAGAQAPAFDAASIKPNHSLGGPSSIRFSNGRVTMQYVSLMKLMLNAYGIPDDREYMLDGPGWLTSEHFDIAATFPGDTSVPQARMMMQAMLAERFKLVVHREVRQLPTYSLVIARNGPKIHAVEVGTGSTSTSPGHLEAHKISMQKLADILARPVGVRVTDSTGLAGVFDFTLQWSPEESTQMPLRDGAEPAGTAATSIFHALEDQLGLRLVAAKGPVEVLVVDHIEKTPTEN